MINVFELLSKNFQKLPISIEEIKFYHLNMFPKLISWAFVAAQNILFKTICLLDYQKNLLITIQNFIQQFPYTSIILFNFLDYLLEGFQEQGSRWDLKYSYFLFSTQN